MSPAVAERLTAEERREAILAASMEVFARNGLHGVTTRMIADAAGVSEALLYRHFKSKDDLYAALQDWCVMRTASAADQIAALEPSTSTLVLAIHFMVSEILQSAEGAKRSVCLKRLNLSSLLEDGGFARDFLKANIERYVPIMARCLQAAAKAGDTVDKPRHPAVRVWLCHHLPVMVSSFYLPEQPVVDHGVSRSTLIEEVTRFCLRGLGLNEQAIARDFNPKALALFLPRPAPSATHQ